jgi:hypothetical protein
VIWEQSVWVILLETSEKLICGSVDISCASALGRYAVWYRHACSSSGLVLACILEVLGSSLGRDADYHNSDVPSFTPVTPSKCGDQYLKLGHDRVLPHSPQHILLCHPFSGRCVFWAADSAVEYTAVEQTKHVSVMHLSFRPSISLSVYVVSFYLSVYLFIHLSICLSIFLSIYIFLYFYLSMYLSIWPSVRLFSCLYVFVSLPVDIFVYVPSSTEDVGVWQRVMPRAPHQAASRCSYCHCST